MCRLSGGGLQVAGKTRSTSEIEMLDDHPGAAAHCDTSDEMLPAVQIGHGDVLIAAITSCTNTSNPGVLLAAGLLAKKAVEQASR